MNDKQISEWQKIKTTYDTEAQAQKAANIAAAIETKLANQPGGPLFEIETNVRNINGKWQVLWRKIFKGYLSGCGGGCSTCPQQTVKSAGAKVLPFKKPSRP